MGKKSALGKGLGAIFGDDVVENTQTIEKKNVSRETSMRKNSNAEAVKEEEPGKEYMMKLSLIDPNGEQPRKDFNQEQIAELADSIKRYGVLQPLLVQKKGERYEIIAGERRWRAAKEAGIKEVPVVVREYTRR